MRHLGRLADWAGWLAAGVCIAVLLAAGRCSPEVDSEVKTRKRRLGRVDRVAILPSYDKPATGPAEVAQVPWGPACELLLRIPIGPRRWRKSRP
jgi:hypothetical protein